MSETTAGPGFSDAQRAALACVLDTLVPPSADGRLPGAGALGLAAPLEALVAATPGLGALVAAGLEALETLARSRAAKPSAPRDRASAEAERFLAALGSG